MIAFLRRLAVDVAYLIGWLIGVRIARAVSCN